MRLVPCKECDPSYARLRIYSRLVEIYERYREDRDPLHVARSLLDREAMKRLLSKLRATGLSEQRRLDEYLSG